MLKPNIAIQKKNVANTVGTLTWHLNIWPSWADLCELFSEQVSYSRDSKLCSRISLKVQAIGKLAGFPISLALSGYHLIWIT